MEVNMKILSVDLQNCYGIKKLNYKFDFDNHHNYILYASNGMMKTSFTKTFKALSSKRKPSDEVYERKTVCDVKVDDAPITPEQIFVINSYEDEYISPNSAKLMVKKELRQEYDAAMAEVSNSRNAFLAAIDEILHESQMSLLLLSQFLNCQPIDVVENLSKEIDNGILGEDFFKIDFSSVKYGDIISDSIASFLSESKNLELIQEYTDRYNELLEKSPIFKRGIFSHNNADVVSQSLSSNGFFDANHTIYFDGLNKTINSADDFSATLEAEKQKIFSDDKLRKKFDKINSTLGKRALLNFRGFIEKYPDVIPLLTDYSSFKRKIWVSVLKDLEQELIALIRLYNNTQDVISKIKERAKEEKTQWDYVLEIFKSRFSVPFSIEIPNYEDVYLLGSLPEFVFKYVDSDSGEEAEIPRKNLEKILSQGEKRALFLLNIINDLEAIKLAKKPCLIIADDVAESFDYKNKYAIIEYLQEMMSDENLHFIILTHNFDFYRSVSSRTMKNIFPQMVQRVQYGLEIVNPKYVFKNPFEEMKKGIKDNDDKDIVTSIPFVRNIIEYTRNASIDTNYGLLTALLHIKDNTKSITLKDLEDIFNKEIKSDDDYNFSKNREDMKVYDLIISLARSEAQITKERIELDGKIIISIATRLLAEEFMINKLKSKSVDLGDISKNQTGKLLQLYKTHFPSEIENIKTMNKVVLMSSENIHINSFMFEPLIDISIKSLIDLFGNICIINPPVIK